MRPGDDNPRILLLVNGHRLNDRIYDTAAVGTEFPLDLALIDHIEVVRGPGSSLYGTNAIFGVINVITRDPGRETALEMEGGTGSLDSRTGRGTLLGKLGPVSGPVVGQHVPQRWKRAPLSSPSSPRRRPTTDGPRTTMARTRSTPLSN